MTKIDEKSESKIVRKVEIKKDLITLGICAMPKKSLSKPMTEILNRIAGPHIGIIIFGYEMIL